MGGAASKIILLAFISTLQAPVLRSAVSAVEAVSGVEAGEAVSAGGVGAKSNRHTMKNNFWTVYTRYRKCSSVH